MNESAQDRIVFLSLDWEFEPHAYRLRHVVSKEVHDLGPQCSAVLELLCRNNGETVTRNRFIDEIWHGNYAVGDRGLRQDIWRIRKALKVDGKNDHLVTVPRVGYRLECGDLTVLTVPERRRKRLFGRVALALLAVSVPILLFAISRFVTVQGITEPADNIERGMPVSHFEGLVESPSIAPGGDRVAYAARTDDKVWSIRVERLDQSAKVIEINPASEQKLLEPVFSPDGQRVAYLRRVGGYDRLNEYQVIIHDLEAGKERIVARAHGVMTVQPGMDWSHDGNYLLFPQAEGTDQLPIRIVQLDIEKGETTPLTEPVLVDIGPAYRPDSLDFSFARLEDASGADLYASIGGELRRLTDENAYIHSHAWLDQKRYIVSVYQNEAYRPFLGSLDRQGLVALNADPGFRSPEPAGDSIYWVRSSYSVGSRIASLSRPEETWLLKPVGLVRKDAAFHPQQPLLAVSDDRTGFTEIWLTGLKGNNERQLTYARSRLIEPRWSPGGRILVARLDDSDSPVSRPVRIDLESGELIEIAPPGVSLVGFQFTADSRYGAAVHLAPVPEIWRLTLESSEGASQVFAGKVDRFHVLTGSRIGFMQGSSARIIDLATGAISTQSASRFASEQERLQPTFTWQPRDNSMVLFDRSQPDSPRELLSVDLSSTPGYGFSVDEKKGLASWNEFVTHKKRLYRSRLQ